MVVVAILIRVTKGGPGEMVPIDQRPAGREKRSHDIMGGGAPG